MDNPSNAVTQRGYYALMQAYGTSNGTYSASSGRNPLSTYAGASAVTYTEHIASTQYGTSIVTSTGVFIPTKTGLWLMHFYVRYTSSSVGNMTVYSDVATPYLSSYSTAISINPLVGGIYEHSLIMSCTIGSSVYISCTNTNDCYGGYCSFYYLGYT